MSEYRYQIRVGVLIMVDDLISTREDVALAFPTRERAEIACDAILRLNFEYAKHHPPEHGPPFEIVDTRRIRLVDTVEGAETILRHTLEDGEKTFIEAHGIEPADLSADLERIRLKPKDSA